MMASGNLIERAKHRATALMRRLLPPGQTLEDAAIESEVIDPGEMRAGRGGLCLPGQLERLTAVAFELPLEDELAAFTSGKRAIAPTIRHLVRNAVIGPLDIRCEGGSRLYRAPGDTLGGTGDVPTIALDEAALRSSYVGIHYFGHWLRDDCATQLLAESYGPAISMTTPDWPDKPAYRALLGRDYRETPRARIGRLHLFEDIGQNDHKVARFRTMRAHFAARATQRSMPDIVYLARGAGATARQLVNEEALIDALAARGVHILRAEHAPVDTIVAALQGARILISVEGSQISHGLLTLADKAGILAIQPPDRFFNSHMDWSHALDMHYAIVVGTSQPGGFSISESELFATLDLLDRAIG